MIVKAASAATLGGLLHGLSAIFQRWPLKCPGGACPAGPRDSAAALRRRTALSASLALPQLKPLRSCTALAHCAGMCMTSYLHWSIRPAWYTAPFIHDSQWCTRRVSNTHSNSHCWLRHPPLYHCTLGHLWMCKSAQLHSKLLVKQLIIQ
jgi:hypothetical protein